MPSICSMSVGTALGMKSASLYTGTTIEKVGRIRAQV